MKEINGDPMEDEEEEYEEPSHIKFVCPSCREIDREDVLFLCNTCQQTELIYKDGIYMCPSCLKPGDNFECNSCGSKKVEMIIGEKK